MAIGDWVVGISHNSEHQTVCGYVVDLMPKQGTCNIKILRWREEHYTEEGNSHIAPIETCRPIEDYGDSKSFIRVDDGLRMIHAVYGSGNWDAPYFATKPFIY